MVFHSKMSLNFSTSSVMWFQTNFKYPNIIINDTTLKSVDRQKHLGIIFDTELSWIHWVSETCENMSCYLILISIA